MARGGIYVIRESSGPWTRLDFDIVPTRLVKMGRQSLLFNRGGEVVLVDPDKPAPIPLMAPTEATEWRTIPGASKPVKALPSWAAQAPWKYQPEWGMLGPGTPTISISYHDGHLYLLRPPDLNRDSFELLVFVPDRSEPVSIPLQFLYKGSDLMAKKILKWSDRAFDLYATNQGVCLQNEWSFWFIPYSDIDDYLKSHPDSGQIP